MKDKILRLGYPDLESDWCLLCGYGNICKCEVKTMNKKFVVYVNDVRTGVFDTRKDAEASFSYFKDTDNLRIEECEE